MGYSLNDAFTQTLPLGSHRYSSRKGNDVDLAVIHTAEGARTNASLANFFNNGGVKASSHAGVDDNGLARLVPETYSAWTAGPANPRSTQIEICGFARWSAAEWRSHASMLEYLARWCAAVSVYHDIPLVRLHPSQVRRGRGFCMHYDITVGWPTGSHTDAGRAFDDHIFDGVLARARAIVAAGTHEGSGTITDPTIPTTEDFLMALTDAQQTEVLEGIRSLKTTVRSEVNGGLAAHLRDVLGGLAEVVRLARSNGGKSDRIYQVVRVSDDRLTKGLREQAGARLTEARVRTVLDQTLADAKIPAATVDLAAKRVREAFLDAVEETAQTEEKQS